MSKIDRLKEEIGWLKLAFAIVAAIDASLIAWIAQNYATAPQVLRISCTVAIVVVTVIGMLVNRAALRRFEELEKQ